MNGHPPGLPSTLYIQSAVQTPPFYSTDEYVQKTEYMYHLETERLLMVGNPYFAVNDTDKQRDAVPKVSANQYRVFRLRLPDPNNQFDLPDGLLDPSKYRYCWQLVGIEVCRGQPLGVGPSAAPAFNKGRDVEAPTRMLPDDPMREDDNRVNVAIDPKQNQMLIVGCAPAVGQHWTAAKPCDDDTLDTDCPPIELVNSSIEDGDMSDIGFGAMDFGTLGANGSDIPLELVSSTSKYPDWIKMHTDPFGDSCFYFVRREQLYTRRMWQHSGGVGESIPKVLPGESAYSSNNSAYVSVPSGSVVTTDTQLFNRTYWLGRAQGPNNCMCWAENIFVTLLDNTRNIIMNISTKSSGAGNDYDTVYKPKNYKSFARHVEEYKIMCMVRLCRVSLEADVLAHLYRTAPYVLERWGISDTPQTGPATRTEDRYRYIESQATRCPLPAPPPPPADVDPWGSLHFWDVDCRDALSPELPRFPLGRKFLALPGSRTLTTRPGARKRPATTTESRSVSSNTRSTSKRRKR